MKVWIFCCAIIKTFYVSLCCLWLIYKSVWCSETRKRNKHADNRKTWRVQTVFHTITVFANVRMSFLQAFSFSSWTCCFRNSMIWSASAARCSSLISGLGVDILIRERETNLEGNRNNKQPCLWNKTQSADQRAERASRKNKQKQNKVFWIVVNSGVQWG